MDADIGYDTTNFQALRLELEQLNAAALKSGLLPPVTGWFGAPDAAPAKRAKPRPAPKARTMAKTKDSKRPAIDPADRGKARARRLLAMLGRIVGDDSPAVPGTAFTESGVVRLLAHLRKPRNRRARFLRRMQRFLARPVALGLQTSAGVSVERLQMVSHRLREIEAHGLAHVRSVRAARRGKPPTESTTTE